MKKKNKIGKENLLKSKGNANGEEDGRKMRLEMLIKFTKKLYN